MVSLMMIKDMPRHLESCRELFLHWTKTNKTAIKYN